LTQPRSDHADVVPSCASTSPSRRSADPCWARSQEFAPPTWRPCPGSQTLAERALACNCVSRRPCRASARLARALLRVGVETEMATRKIPREGRACYRADGSAGYRDPILLPRLDGCWALDSDLILLLIHEERLGESIRAVKPVPVSIPRWGLKKEGSAQHDARGGSACRFLGLQPTLGCFRKNNHTWSKA
jgi:hypothetical protein